MRIQLALLIVASPQKASHAYAPSALRSSKQTHPLFLRHLSTSTIRPRNDNLATKYAWKQVGSDLDGESEGDNSGYSVAMSADGSRVVIGALLNDGNGNDSGHVRVYEEENGDWKQIGSDVDGESQDDLSGSAVAMSADGTRIVVGASFNDGNGNDSGHARVYQEVNGDWEQIGSDVDGESQDDLSGYSVAMSADGTRIIVGAPFNDGNGTTVPAGHVRVFEEVNGDWQQIGSDVDGESQGDRSGFSVAMSADGTRIVVGAPANDANGDNSGHVNVYQEVNSTWKEIGSLDGESQGDLSGWSAAISADGTRIVVGAPANDAYGDDSGHVNVYEEVNSGTWKEIGSLEGEFSGDSSGWSAAMSADGTIIVVGTPGNDANGDDSGHVNVYEEVNSTWKEIGSSLEGELPGDLSGWSVAMSADGTRIVVGAPFNDGSRGQDEDSGHARVFEYMTVTTSPTNSPTFDPTPTREQSSSGLTIIVISSTLLFSLSFVAIIVWYRQRRRDKKHDASSPGAAPASQPPLVVFDAFLTHNWGPDGQGRDNHKRVVQFKNHFDKEFGNKHSLWLDEERMTGDIQQQMCDGIDQSMHVIVFITKEYIDKVAGRGPMGDKDNCRLEFNYAARKKGPSKLIAVVMEDACSDTKLWDGPVGLNLGGQLYFSYEEDSDLEQCAQMVFEDMAKRKSTEVVLNSK